MTYVPFTSLPPTAKTWVFGASDALDEQTVGRIREEMTGFISDWTAHGVDLPASFDVLSDRFLVVAADDAAQPGGCSVDRLFRLVGALGEQASVAFLDSSLVFWREGDGRVRSASREEFHQLAASGEVGPATMVFDVAVDRLDALHDGGFEKQAADSWHAKLLAE
ncbi:MAG: hypothetical protein ACSLFQ_01780 [Thermoanaerobaculia bacterium]